MATTTAGYSRRLTIDVHDVEIGDQVDISIIYDFPYWVTVTGFVSCDEDDESPGIARTDCDGCERVLLLQPVEASDPESWHVEEDTVRVRVPIAA